MTPYECNESVCEFLGWYCGDGCISVNARYSEFALTGDVNDEYQFYKSVITPAFNQLFSLQLKKPAVLKSYSKVGVCGLYVFDKSFVKFLETDFCLKSGKKLNISVPLVVQTADDKRCFLRGLCDTDGSIYFCKSNFKTKKLSPFTIFHYKPKIKIATISSVLMHQVHELLISLGFSPRLSKEMKRHAGECEMHSVVLDRKRDVGKWLAEIGFRSQKHLTKIAIWEQFGFCPPKTTLAERIAMLNGKINPLDFYPKYADLPLDDITRNFGKLKGVTRNPYSKRVLGKNENCSNAHPRVRE